MLKSYREKIGFNDFILIKGSSNFILNDFGFIKKEINSNIKLLYKNSLNNNLFELQEEVITINQSFINLFYYYFNDIVLICPDFKYLLKLPLKLDYDGIKEFILFNTPLFENTLFKNVLRKSNVHHIVLKDNIKFLFFNGVESSNLKSTYQTFIDSINIRNQDFKNRKHAILLSGGYESRINAAISSFYSYNSDFFTWGHPENIEFTIANRIAQKLRCNHYNLRTKCKPIDYINYAETSGYLSNIQYAFRLKVLEILQEKNNYDYIWSGWADIVGFTNINQSSELISPYLISKLNKLNFPNFGWKREWLSECAKHIQLSFLKELNTKKLFEFKNSFLAPVIFGQVITNERIKYSLVTPWFTNDIYNSVIHEENGRQRIKINKLDRTLWKGNLYYSLLKRYENRLNYIVLSKGYSPFFLQKNFNLIGLFISGLLKNVNARRNYPYDPVEDKDFLYNELLKALDSKFELFDNKSIFELTQRKDSWNGIEIFEIYKIIQIHWLLTKYA